MHLFAVTPWRVHMARCGGELGEGILSLDVGCLSALLSDSVLSVVSCVYLKTSGRVRFHCPRCRGSGGITLANARVSLVTVCARRALILM